MKLKGMDSRANVPTPAFQLSHKNWYCVPSFFIVVNMQCFSCCIGLWYQQKEEKLMEQKKSFPFKGTDTLSLAQLQAGWLKKISLGIIVLAVGISLVVSLLLLLFIGADIRIWLPENVSILIWFIACLVGYLGIWLLTVPEPGNKKWLWYLRWPLRISVVTSVGISVWGIFCPVMEIIKDYIIWQYVFYFVLVIFPPLFLFLFLSCLASRFEIRKFRKRFVILTWITCVITALILFAILSGYTPNAEVHSSTEGAVEANNTPNYVGISVWIVFFAWLNMLLLKFAKQLRKIADEKIKKD